MSSCRPSSIVAYAIAAIVFVAACGVMVRIPAPLNAAGALVRAKRTRRVETASELCTQYAPAEQSLGSSAASSISERRSFDRLCIRAIQPHSVCAHRLARGWLTPPILDGTPELPVMRC